MQLQGGVLGDARGCVVSEVEVEGGRMFWIMKINRPLRVK